jgi:DNA-binding transcriptional LysR family regulator
MLHSRILRYLDEVARSGTIRRAAEQLNVSASSINRQIIELEEDLGTPLFKRLPRQMRLTAAGELLIAHVRSTLKEYERLRGRIERLRGVRTGNIRIAAMHGIAGGVLPPIIARFRKDHPGVTISVQAQVVSGVVQALLSGEADLGLAYSLPPHPGLTVSAIFETRLGVIVAPGHPLAGRAFVRLADCLDHPTVLGDASLTINKLMIEAFSRAGISFEPDFVSNSVEMMKSMAKSHEAITFLSRIDVAEDIREGSLVYVPIAGSRLSNHELMLARRDRGPLDVAVSLIEEDIRSAVQKVEMSARTGSPSGPSGEPFLPHSEAARGTLGWPRDHKEDTT